VAYKKNGRDSVQYRSQFPNNKNSLKKSWINFPVKNKSQIGLVYSILNITLPIESTLQISCKYKMLLVRFGILFKNLTPIKLF